MRTRLAFPSALVLVALATGCGVAERVTPQPTSSAGPAKPQIGPGTVMTDALKEAHCSDNGAGVWSASGVIENTTKKALAFDVTIYVGLPGGQGGTAHMTRVPTVAPGKSANWASPVVESTSPAGPCHIQVRVAK